ncbi:MAG TPA: LytR C-terminal domain-containing protein, partial [Patescibacteria group bacterium]|nr:LytR C-terminal domain-containing protein [Patescibacteria group bacterium]
KKRLPSRALFLVVVIIILILIIFAIFRSFFASSSNESISPTPTTTEFQFPTDVPEESLTPEISPEDEVTKTPTPKPTSNTVDKESGLDRSELSVAIENGSGIGGAAGKATNILKSLGYKVTSTSNADNFDYENLTIKVKSGVSKYLSLLKKDLSDDYTIGQTSSDLSASSSADALIIIGK